MLRRKKGVFRDSSHIYRKLWNKEHGHSEVESGDLGCTGEELERLEGRSVHYLNTHKV